MCQCGIVRDDRSTAFARKCERLVRDIGAAELVTTERSQTGEIVARAATDVEHRSHVQCRHDADQVVLDVSVDRTETLQIAPRRLPEFVV